MERPTHFNEIAWHVFFFHTLDGAGGSVVPKSVRVGSGLGPIIADPHSPKTQTQIEKKTILCSFIPQNAINKHVLHPGTKHLVCIIINFYLNPINPN